VKRSGGRDRGRCSLKCMFVVGLSGVLGGRSLRLASALSTSDIEELLLISVSDDGDGQ